MIEDDIILSSVESTQKRRPLLYVEKQEREKEKKIKRSEKKRRERERERDGGGKEEDKRRKKKRDRREIVNVILSLHVKQAHVSHGIHCP